MRLVLSVAIYPQEHFNTLEGWNRKHWNTSVGLVSTHSLKCQANETKTESREIDGHSPCWAFWCRKHVCFWVARAETQHHFQQGRHQNIYDIWVSFKTQLNFHTFLGWSFYSRTQYFRQVRYFATDLWNPTPTTFEITTERFKKKISPTAHKNLTTVSASLCSTVFHYLRAYHLSCSPSPAPSTFLYHKLLLKLLLYSCQINLQVSLKIFIHKIKFFPITRFITWCLPIQNSGWKSGEGSEAALFLTVLGGCPMLFTMLT